MWVEATCAMADLVHKSLLVGVSCPCHVKAKQYIFIVSGSVEMVCLGLFGFFSSYKEISSELAGLVPLTSTLAFILITFILRHSYCLCLDADMGNSSSVR